MRSFNNTNASLILAIFNNLGSKNERVSVTTENAPVYNVMQQEIQMTQKNFQLWKSQSTKSAPQMMEGNQQIFNNSNSLIPTMNEEANSTHNTMSAQYISLQNICMNVQQKQHARGL